MRSKLAQACFDESATPDMIASVVFDTYLPTCHIAIDQPYMALSA